MLRHNRTGKGVDQRGFAYRISYPPNWLDRIRVTRRLESGRQSTRTLFVNPQRGADGEQGDLVRLTIESAEQGLRVEARVRVDPGRFAEVSLGWRGGAWADPAMDCVRFTATAFPAGRRAGGT